MRTWMFGVLAAVLAACLCASPARASFHLMQIEQVIGGVNGDVSAQAIQLRMRSSLQNFLGPSRIVAWDANGDNPVIIFDFLGNVPNGAAGSRVLLRTQSFFAATTPNCIADFIMTNPIPPSYLAAGKLTFQSDSGLVYWSLAWGGAAYMGTNTGLTIAGGGNDADGNFSPAFPLPLPTSSNMALLFQGVFTAPSTNNAADYAVTAGGAVFTNNANATFAVNGGPTIGRCCAGPVCTVVTEEVCMTAGGVWTASGTCAGDACDPAGACCDGSSCSVMVQSACEAAGRQFVGAGITCTVDGSNNYVACCRANFDGENGLGVPDIFAFLAAWFAGNPDADFDGMGGIGVPDIFAFLSAWFAGCS